MKLLLCKLFSFSIKSLLHFNLFILRYRGEKSQHGTDCAPTLWLVKLQVLKVPAVAELHSVLDSHLDKQVSQPTDEASVRIQSNFIQIQ